MGDRKREELREEDTEVEKPDAGKLWLYRHHEAAGELGREYMQDDWLDLIDLDMWLINLLDMVDGFYSKDPWL